MDPVAAVAIQQGLVQQSVSLSGIKQDVQAGQAIAAVLDQSARNVAASGRGTIVNLLA